MGTRLTLNEIYRQLEKKNLDPKLKQQLLKKKKDLEGGKDTKKRH
jgi:hypothetical protein